MVGASRTLTAAVLAAALSCVPVVLAQCAGSCEAHGSAISRLVIMLIRPGRSLAARWPVAATSTRCRKARFEMFSRLTRALAAIAAAPPSMVPHELPAVSHPFDARSTRIGQSAPRQFPAAPGFSRRRSARARRPHALNFGDYAVQERSCVSVDDGCDGVVLGLLLDIFNSCARARCAHLIIST